MRIVLGFLTVFLVACNQGSQSPGTAQQAPSAPLLAALNQSVALIPGTLPLPEVVVDLSSPDRALKTFFAFQDRNFVASFNQNLKMIAGQKRAAHLDGAKILFDGPAKRYIDQIFATDTLILEKYERDINKIETESETRAVVLINIKNITPLLPGSVLDQYETKWRGEGFNYRYIMTKTSEGWKISDVQDLQLNTTTVKYSFERSRLIPPADAKPSVPSLVSPLF